MIKIALVRGHHLSKEETLSYEPLKSEFEFVCFSSNNPWFDHSEIAFPIVTLPSTERLFRHMPFDSGRRLFGIQDNLIGAGQIMFGLSHALQGYDIVHTSDYCHFFSYQAALAKKRRGYKLVAIHYENIPFARERKPLIKQMKEKLYEQADAIFAMSTRAREALILEGVDPRKVLIIGNAVDTNKFQPRPEESILWRKRYGLLPDHQVILFVGRLHESKGVYELLYATKKLTMDPSVDASLLKVVIAGQGKREHELRCLVEELALTEHVELIGPVSHAEIHFLHTIADVFVLPSIPEKYWQEQFGVVLIESMACSKPVVSTLSGSISEVVGDAGILVQPADHVSLYGALKSLLLDSTLRCEYGEKARKRVQSHFSMPVIAAKLRGAYNAILNNDLNFPDPARPL